MTPTASTASGFRKTLPMWILSNDFTVFFIIAISAIGSFYPDGGLAREGFFISAVGVLGLTLRFLEALDWCRGGFFLDA